MVAVTFWTWKARRKAVQDGSKVGEGNGRNSLMASAGERVRRENGFHRLLMLRAFQLVCSFGSVRWQAVWCSEWV